MARAGHAQPAARALRIGDYLAGWHAGAVLSTSPSESTLWLIDLARGGASPLSSGRGRNDTPVWSPDGTRVMFAADRDGAQNLYVKSVDDATPEQLFFQSDVPFKNPARLVARRPMDRDDAARPGYGAERVVARRVWQEATDRHRARPGARSRRPDLARREMDGVRRRRERPVRSLRAVVPRTGPEVQVSEGSARSAPGGRATAASSCCSAPIFERSRASISHRVPPSARGRRKRSRDCPLTSCGSTRCPIVSDSWRSRQNAPAPGSVTVVQNWRAALVQKR